jgi:cell division protein ZapA (FtsZ GTPase activity inhibitor)
MTSKIIKIYSILSLSIVVLLSIFYQGELLSNNSKIKQIQHDIERKTRQGDNTGR